MREFRYVTPEFVCHGPGAIARLGPALERLRAERAFLLTTGSLVNHLEPVLEQLGARHVGTFSGCGQHSPAGSVDAATELAEGADVLVSFGGGSVIDTAKAVAMRIGQPAHVAIPTTLSAGEFTAGAGITDEQRRFKDLIVHRGLLPKVVIHDPELTVATPAALWLSTGIKALDHALEALWARRSHPVTALTARDAAQRLLRSLKASADPSNMDARADCFMGAWLSIIGMANTGTRLSHPIGHQIGAHWNVPHGVTSCVALPVVMRGLGQVTGVVDEVVAPLFGVTTADAAASALEELVDVMQLPRRLRDTVAVEEEIPAVAASVEAEFEHLGQQADLPIEPLLRQMW